MDTKLRCQMRPIRIGSPYEMYKPIVAIEVAAAKATLDPRDGRARMKDKVAASHTVRIGDRNRSSTLWKKDGIPPSREKANIIRLLDVMENNPQCHTHTVWRSAHEQIERYEIPARRRVGAA